MKNNQMNDLSEMMVTAAAAQVEPNTMNDVNAAEFQSVLSADLNRAMIDAQLRSQAEKDLPTLTKAELAELLFEQVGLNKREAKDMVETFFDEIRDALERGESVKLSGFGNFQLRDKPQRPGRNPKTGEEIPITARRVVTFHASQKLKGMVELTSVAAGKVSPVQAA
jgi:integration host factor subunit alpha